MISTTADRRLLARPADDGGHEGRCSTELCTWFVSLEDHDEVHAAYNLHRCADHLRADDQAVTVISFGYGHGAPPAADITIDLRERLRDPHIDPALRQMTGRDKAVQDKVMATPGARDLVLVLDQLAAAMTVPGKPLTIAIGCVGGRHRSVVIADQLSVRLNGHGQLAKHRDVDFPVLARKTDEVAAVETWRSMDTAPTDGTMIIGLYDDTEVKIRWAESRVCMLATVAPGAGGFGPGWEEVDNGLYAEDPDGWRPVNTITTDAAPAGER